MDIVKKQYSTHGSCVRHLKTLDTKGVRFYHEAINQIDEGCWEVSYKVFDIPLDLCVDMATILQQFCDMYNCNDEILETHGIDWAYMHKLNRRVQFRIEDTNKTK